MNVGRLRGVAAAAAPEPTVALTTVPHVHLLAAGEDWETSTGVFSFDVDDLASAVAAQADHALPTPVLKLGHTDPRFDGQPSFGRVINLSAENGGQDLYGDYAAVPVWLAECLESAYPRRSIEGAWDQQTKTGNRWRFALTAVALLGATYPAITTLADIPLMFGATPPPLVAQPVGLVPEPSMAAAGAVTVALRRS